MGLSLLFGLGVGVDSKTLLELLSHFLVSSLVGDVEIGLQERNGQLEVDIIQARGLTAKPGSKTLPGVRTSERYIWCGLNFWERETSFLFIIIPSYLVYTNIPNILGTQKGSESIYGEVGK